MRLPRPPLPVLAALTAFVLAASCSKDPGRYWRIESGCSPCELHELARQSVGPGAHDCASDGGTKAELEACAIKLAAAHGTFIAEEKLQGIDSVIRVAYVGDDAGVRQLWFDSDRTGGAGKCRARVTQSTCRDFPGSALGHLCQEPRDRKLICDEATSRVLQTELGGATRDLWCAQDPDDPQPDRLLVCARNQLSLRSALALVGAAEAKLVHETGDLFCSADTLGPGLLGCTPDPHWRRALGYFPSERVVGPLAGSARGSPEPVENR